MRNKIINQLIIFFGLIFTSIAAFCGYHYQAVNFYLSDQRTQNAFHGIFYTIYFVVLLLLSRYIKYLKDNNTYYREERDRLETEIFDYKLKNEILNRKLQKQKDHGRKRK